jgi:ATP-dependent RNA helicase DHX37/DHR1
LNNVVEGAVLSVEQGDTNYLALPSKREAESSASQTTTKQKRPRLGKKQKKRLKKVVQAKEKTAKRKEILERLQELQIPQSEQSLLQSSTGLGQKKTAKSVQLLTSDNSIPTVSLNSPRRKRKRKQKLRIEKQLITLTHPTHSSSEDESSDDSEEDVSVATCSVQTSKGETSQEVKETSQTSKSKDVGSGDGGNDVGTGEVPVLSQQGDHSSENELEAFTEPPYPLSSSSGKESSVVPVDEGRVLQDSCPMEGTSSPISREKAVFIPVHRNPAVQAARLELPILGEEQVVMETINENPVTVLCGETGSGKTTQVPQFLYEAGYTRKYGGSMIGITQPRRVAAVSMSKRVAEEMNLSTRRVSYQIRYEGNVSDETEIKFMTDGVLLKEIESDFLLSKYSVIMIDEAHERSVFTDILIGLLSRIVPLREKNGCPLKMIISSATLRVEDFTDNRSLFSTVPPVVKVDSRQFPVTVHFNKRTPVDYITEAYRKVCKIHRQLKDGSILVFVTGQKEVHDLCRKLRNTFVSSASNEGECKETEDAEKVEQLPKKIRRKKEQTIDLDRYSVIPCDNGDDGNGDGDVYHMDEEEDSDDGIFDGNYDDANDESYEGVEKDRELPLLVLPLYSMLSSERQALVFEPPPEGVRLCVVATNVAETSLTIPNMKYVVDTGKVKSRYYDGVTGISTFR